MAPPPGTSALEGGSGLADTGPDVAVPAARWTPSGRNSLILLCSFARPPLFRTGDKLLFTRNNYTAERLNGTTAMVVAIDAQGSSVMVEKDDGERQMLDLRQLADRHIRPGWVRTIHSSQGATCDRVMAHLESFRAHTVDAASAYVAIFRAREGAAIYTDSRAKLTEALGLRDGAQVGAIDETMGRDKRALMSLPSPDAHLAIERI